MPSAMNNSSNREHVSHGSPYIPYSYYKCLIPDFYPWVPPHWHKEFEINYILNGEGIFRCGERSANVKAGDIIVLLPNTLHSISPAAHHKLSYDTIVFNQSMLIGNGRDRCFYEFLYPLTAASSSMDFPLSSERPFFQEIKACTGRIFSCVKGNSGSMDFLLRSELIRMFWLIIENGYIRCDGSPSLSAESIRPAIEFIQEHFDSEIRISMLAEKVHLSQSYFMNKFKRITGMSAAQYVEQIRIRSACEQLLHSDKTSAEIAFCVGFGNLSNFNRQFRKTLGCSPHEYKKDHLLILHGINDF